MQCLDGSLEFVKVELKTKLFHFEQNWHQDLQDVRRYCID